MTSPMPTLWRSGFLPASACLFVQRLPAMPQCHPDS
uniref:Uncharacterized protein n=1 Tax=Setaria italica TaxID=4555 RepID=K4AN20_SETIT